MGKHLGLFAAVAFFILIVSSEAADEDMLQDFCVRDTLSNVVLNGFTCKPLAGVVGTDFKSSVLRIAGNTNNRLGSAVTAANVITFPGLNTLGVSFARIDYAVGGVNPPHVHPRATEILYLQQGSLAVGFISTTNNTLYADTLLAGDLYVFPRGLVHFQINTGTGPAIALVGFNGQNPGTTQVARAVFASNPAIRNDVIRKAFQMTDGEVNNFRNLIRQT